MYRKLSLKTMQSAKRTQQLCCSEPAHTYDIGLRTAETNRLLLPILQPNTIVQCCKDSHYAMAARVSAALATAATVEIKPLKIEGLPLLRVVRGGGAGSFLNCLRTSAGANSSCKLLVQQQQVVVTEHIGHTHSICIHMSVMCSRTNFHRKQL
jgi:hypothetical protein